MGPVLTSAEATTSQALSRLFVSRDSYNPPKDAQPAYRFRGALTALVDVT